MNIHTCPGWLLSLSNYQNISTSSIAPEEFFHTTLSCLHKLGILQSMAATMMTSLSVFPLFLSLPPELRNQIWHDALPEKDEPALFPYRKGCWCPRCISGSGNGYNPEYPADIYLEFRHDLLEPVQVEVPLVFVNREARTIALAWVHNQGIEMRFREDKQCHVFVRPFDPAQDTLYITPDEVDDYYTETLIQPYEPGPNDRFMNTPCPSPTRIAVPEAQIQRDPVVLFEMIDWFYNLRELFIIVGRRPDLEEDMKMQRQWKLKSTHGRAYFWNRNHGGFDWSDSEDISDKALCRWMKKASKELSVMATKNSVPGFGIRPVLAVRR